MILTWLMPMTDDAISKYREALAAYDEAVRQIRSMGSKAAVLAEQLQGVTEPTIWQNIKVLNHPDFAWPSDRPAAATACDVDALRWRPFLDDLVVALNAAHAARRLARTLWEKIPQADRHGDLVQPPD